METPSPSPSVILKEMSDGAVLYSTDTEVYFGLNQVGLAIWRALTNGSSTLEGIVSTLAKEYPDVPSATIRADAVAFLRELEENGLVTPPEGAVQAR